MNRIKVSASATGATTEYTFLVNPTFYNPIDITNTIKKDVLHGAPVRQEIFSDNRDRILEWYNFPVNNVSINSVIDYLRSVEGEVKYFNFEDLEDMNDGWPTDGLEDVDWKKVRISSLSTEYRKGGKLVYEKIRLIITPE